MKKFFLFAVSAVVLTVGCQKIQELVKPGSESVDDSNPVEIKFTSNVVNLETKANGAVTAFSADHTLYIYGINEDTEGVKEIHNEPATSTAAASEDGSTKAAVSWVDADAAFFYNGTVDKYNFYGYYIDDAKVSAEPSKANNYTFDVTITGQQDILLAKADPAADFAAGSYTTVNAADAYSAKTARAGLHPNLKFEHQLSQFTFSVRNHGNADVTLKAISLNAVNEGTLTVVGEQKLVAKTATKDLELPMADRALAKKPADSDNAFIDLDGSIIAFPAKEYTAKVYLWQEGMPANAVRAVTVPVTITNKPEHLTGLGSDPGALVGYAYNLQMTVYSLAEVEITASLVAWKPGKVHVLDTEDTSINATEKEEAWLSIDTTEKSVAAAGETFVVNVTVDEEVDYTVTIPTDAAWITQTNVEDAYTFVVAENTTETEREAVITFATADKTVELTVTQAGVAQGN